MPRGFLRRILPPVLRRNLSSNARKLRAMLRAPSLRRRLQRGPCRIVIGASGIYEEGWIPTDVEELDLLSDKAWARYLKQESVDAILAEHVWEHLTLAEGRMAAELCYRYLKRGGYIRVAVPDGLHPDEDYRRYIGVEGTAGGPIGAHKVVYTYVTLKEVFESVGFTTRLLEYHDEGGNVHAQEWDSSAGRIHRSGKHDPRGFVSIILDAMK